VRRGIDAYFFRRIVSFHEAPADRRLLPGKIDGLRELYAPELRRFENSRNVEVIDQSNRLDA